MINRCQHGGDVAPYFCKNVARHYVTIENIRSFMMCDGHVRRWQAKAENPHRANKVTIGCPYGKKS